MASATDHVDEMERGEISTIPIDGIEIAQVMAVIGPNDSALILSKEISTLPR